MYDNANSPRWNLEVEPFVIRWIVQKEEDICVLGLIKDHMVPWGVVGKKKMLLLIHDKISKKKGCWSTINLTPMMEVTKAQLLNTRRL
jgi:hypothetical protein